MQIDRITVELRPRSSWEAAELGIALVRANARAIWRPWFIATLPIVVVLNAVGWWLDVLPWIALALWWLKPVFDRVPLFVLSRAVFDAVPGTRATLAAQRTWGWGPMLHYLTWRRLGPYRSLYLPVDLLEGGENKGERRKVIGGSARGVAGWLTLVFANFEIALFCGVLALLPLLVPIQQLVDSARTLVQTVFVEQPKGAALFVNLVQYAAMSAMEPFYVGAGFGLYINRRTQLEAWDVELAFRRMRGRLAATLAIACLALGIAAMPAQQAWAATPAAAATTTSLPAVFADDYVPTTQFEHAVDATDTDPLLHPKETRTTWVLREKPKPRKINPDAGFFAVFARVVAVIIESGLWIVLGLIVLALVLTAKRWWPWLRDTMPVRREPETPIVVEDAADAAALPADIVGTALRLWREGFARRALALVYRASVESMVARTGAVLVPGATEAECLRASRALGQAEDREAFASVVRTWQYAAYADRMPDAAAFEALLVRLSQRFGWAA